MPNTALNAAPLFPATAATPPAPPAAAPNQGDSLSLHRGSFNWVETPNGGLLAVHPNGEGVDWVETPGGGLLAYPKQQVNPSWLHSAIPGHLDSAPYRSDSPSHANAGPMPGGESYLSPVPQAPSWDQVPVPTPAVAAAADANLRNPQVLDDLAARWNEPSANERVASS